MARRHRLASIVLGLLVSTGACAVDVNVVGLFPNKAVVQIDGGALQTLSVGQKAVDGVVLVSVEGDSATFDVQGRRMTLALGHAHMKTDTSAASAMVITDEHGHLVTAGQVNGMPVRFAVDTGATFITLPAGEALRLGLDYLSGQKTLLRTANGTVVAYRVRLDTVRVGNVALNSVDAVVMEGDSLPVALLGMSFLNRVDIKREGEIMTLTKRY